jgi:uncharacterized repeat protein (TIGR03806 family)
VRTTPLLAALALTGCGGTTMPPSPYPDLLSQWNLFKPPLADQQPNDNLLPYEVNSILYADGAGKYRFLSVPQNRQIHFDPHDRWTFPPGTIFIKTFDYNFDDRHPEMGRRLLETRLIVLGDDGTWTAHTYVWNDAQTDATRQVAGQSLAIQRIDSQGNSVTGEYRVPNTTQCKDCHAQDKVIVPLGPRTRQLNRTHDYGQGPENQIAHLAGLNLLDSAIPDPATLDKLADPAGNAPVEARARAYLDANCAHCHNDSGYASSTALRLNAETTTPIDLGVCRHPVAAGHANGGFLYDVVPGHPDMSILIFRMQSNDPQFKMPQLPLTTSDAFGVDLVSQWIAALPPANCQ